MKDFEIFLKDKDPHELEYASCRAKNLAEEIIVGWTDQTDLDGFEHTLTAHALEYYGKAIEDGLTETHHDEFARNTITLCCRTLSWEMQDGVDSKLGYDATVFAARALKAFSAYLRAKLDKPPAPALAA